MAQLQEVFLFQPTSVPGCQLWLDGADPNANGILPTNGSSLTTWTDKSGNGKNFTVNGTPGTYNTTRKALVLSNNRYDSSFSANVTNETLFTVFLPTLNQSMYIFYPQPSTGGRGVGTYGSASMYGIVNGDVAWGATTSGLNGTNTVNIGVSTVANKTDTRVSANGGSLTSVTTVPAFSAGNTKLGVYDGSLYSWYGDVYEIIAYNTVLTIAQIQQVEGYLAWKWGLVASLPSNHPYKNYRPLANQPIPPQVPIMPTVGQNTPVFNPASISGCQLWLDAGDPTSFSLNGSTITQWRDKSGNGRNATASGAPVLQLNSINGLPSIFYDGISGGSFSGSISITTTSIFAFAVFVSNMTGSSEGMRIISFTGPGCADWNCSTTVIPFLYDTNRIQTWRNSSTTTNLTCPAQGSTILTTTYYDGSTAYNSLFGGTSSSAIGSSGSFNISNYTMTFGNVNMKGNLGEVIIYNSVLTTNQRQQIEGYLAWKWGVLSSLPANHPYRVQPVFPLSSRLMTTTGSLNSWQPLQVSGCTIWLDGADPNGNGTIPANGASLSSWKDKANNTSVTAPGSAPTFSSNFQNNLGVIRFNGASGTKFYYNTAGFSFGTSQRAAFFVIQNTGPSSGTAASPHWFWPNAGNGANALSFNSWIDANVQGTQTLLAYAASKNVFLIYSFQFGNTSGIGEVFNNGTSQGRFTKTSGGTSFADAGLGYGIGAIPADNTPQYFFDGYIAEAILYNSAVSTSQRQQVEGYLAWKWGLVASLPANHPYKLFPPSP